MGFLIAIVVLGLAWTVSYLWLNRLVEGLLYYWMRPNDHDHYADTAQNKALAVRMATQAAQALSLPVQDAGDGEPA